MKFLTPVFFAVMAAMLLSCAGTRQEMVCEEIEYRLNTMTYSPDQRAYMEEELRVCREQEAQKKAAGAAQRQSIYDRFAASDTTQKKTAAQDTPSPVSGEQEDLSVSEALKDSSGVKTESIYDRYKAVEPAADSMAAENTTPDTSAADVGTFQ